MTDQPALPAPEPTFVDSGPPPTAARRERRDWFPWIYALGFLILAVAIGYVWQNPNTPVDSGANASDMRALVQRSDALDTRLGHLEQQPNPPSAADLGKIAARLDALEGRISDQTQLSSRLDAVSGRIEALSGRDQTGLATTQQQLDSVAARTAALEHSAGDLGSLANRVERLARIEAAVVALASGQPLGDLPGAPPALSRYAHAAPPTVAQLRLAFSEMERSALAASQSNSGSGAFIDRVWERAESLVTVRQGDDVIVGDTSAVVLNHAYTEVEAGDLEGAVRAMATLNPLALHAAAGWLSDAKALIDARSALADMIAHT
jgi:hypothetical protein